MEKEKDLGIVFDNRLHFEQHVSDCTTKARQRIGLVKRNFKHLDERTFLTLYKSLIRPLLEYGSTVWKPYYKKDSEALEKVQRRATKLVPRIKDLPYSSRLKVLQLPTLIYRRRRADMLQVYRIRVGLLTDVYRCYRCLPMLPMSTDVYRCLPDLAPMSTPVNYHAVSRV